MSRPHVTITLGSSGQKVVKRPWANSDSFLVDTPTLSGSKRFPADRNAEYSLFSTNKRLRGDVIQRNSRYSGPSDVRIGDDDLRLKLLRKRMDKRMRLVEQKKIELGEKMSRTIQSSDGPDRSMLSNIPPYRRAGESLQMESLRSPYSSHSMERSRQKSPDNIPKISGGMSSSRSTDEVLRLPPPRPIDTSRLMRSDLLDRSRPRGSASMSIMTSSMRTNLDMCKPVKEIPPASSSILRSPFPEEPFTVSSLLHSLGLGKYAIHFQAEEVDMAALKQMGDRDLKELGIPMGPRKKILLAMLARSKRPIA